MTTRTGPIWASQRNHGREPRYPSSAAQAVSGWLGTEAQRTELLGQTSRQVGSGSAQGAGGMTYYSVVLGDNCA